MPDDFTLEGDNLEPEASLDDFFQPSTEPAKPGKPDPKKAAKPAAADAHLPMDKSKFFPDEEPGTPPTLEVSDAAAEKPAEEKSGGGLLSNKLLLIGIAVLAVLVLSVGAYYGYTKFFNKEEAAAPPPQAKPQAQTPAPAPPTTAKAEPAAETKAQPAAPAKPETPAPPAAKGQPQPATKAAAPPEKKVSEGAKPLEKAAPAPAGKEAAAKQQEIKKAPTVPGAKPAPTVKPAAPTAKAAPVPKVAMLSTGPYTIQVGSYALEESKFAPEAKLKNLGLTDYHYVDKTQRVQLFDVIAGKGLDKTQADALMKSLAGLNFVPRLEPERDRYKVIAYSYGKRADADRAKAKIEKAGLGKVSISSYVKTMTMHQLRVGGFPSSHAAQTTVVTLRKAGFHPVIVRER